MKYYYIPEDECNSICTKLDDGTYKSISQKSTIISLHGHELDYIHQVVIDDIIKITNSDNTLNVTITSAACYYDSPYSNIIVDILINKNGIDKIFPILLNSTKVAIVDESTLDGKERTIVISYEQYTNDSIYEALRILS